MSLTEKQLYRWVFHQKSHCTDPRRRALLEAIPGWEWAVSADEAWENGFKQLQKHGMVKRKFVTEDGFRLGKWINNQQCLCADPNRRKKLESIPSWTWARVSKAFEQRSMEKWEVGFTNLQKYGMVDQKFVTKDGFGLGQWICRQRLKTKDPELRKRLESVPGWTWVGKKGKRMI